MLYQYVKDILAMPSINAIKNFSMSQKNSINTKAFYPNSYLLLNSISLQIHNILQQEITSKIAKYTKKLSSLTKNCSLSTFTSNETITNLTQYELSQEESDLLKAGLIKKRT